MMAAAMTGPTPNRPVRLVPEARTAVSSLFLVSRSWASMRRRSSMRAAASSQRAAATASGGVIDSSSRAASVCDDLLRDAAGDQLAEHRVEPADDLGAGAGQVPAALGLDSQHLRVVIGPGLPDAGRAQRLPGEQARRSKARPRNRVGRRLESQHTGTSQRYDLTLPTGQSPQRLPQVSIRRISRVGSGPAVTTRVVSLRRGVGQVQRAAPRGTQLTVQARGSHAGDGACARGPEAAVGEPA